MKQRTKNDEPRTKSGFTLLELLTVMVIMFVLMGMATVGFRGAMRTTGMTGAALSVQAGLRMARQYAMTHQSRTFVLFDQDGEKAWYYVCAQVGTAVAGGFSDRVNATRVLPWRDGDLVGNEVYNILDGSKMVVSTNKNTLIEGVASEGGAPLSGGDQNVWLAGDAIGLLVREKEYLPAGIVFDEIDGIPDPDPWDVIMQFNHDGTAEYPGGGNGPFDIDLTEKDVATPGTATVTVSGRTGRIE